MSDHGNEEVELNATQNLEEEAREERLKAFLEVKFEELKEESDALKRKLKKQEEKTVKFDKKGHEMQHNFNIELMEIIESTRDAIRRQKITRATALLDDMTDKLEYRQKLIKLADRSKYGWLTVAEYEKDKLARDEADEKRMKDSEKTAEKIDKENKEKEKAKQDKEKGRFHPYRGSSSSSSSTTITRKGQMSDSRYRSSNNSSSNGSSPRFRNAPRNFQSGNYQSGNYQSDNQRRSYDRPCFECGRRDHIARDCPYR